MGKRTLSCEENESIVIISMEGADSKNRIIVGLEGEFEEVRNHIRKNEKIRVVIISGKAMFCRENDRTPFPPRERIDEMIRYLSLNSIAEEVNIPIIAAIHGDALGQGLELALACDLRICTETAHFAMNHLTYGDIPRDGGTQRLSRVVGRGKAMEMILTGEVINAQEAHRIGLVHRVVPEDELLPAAMDMARNMATKSPIAVRYVKEAIHKGLDLTLAQGLRLEADLYFLLHTTKDRTEGIRAFQEKRSPRFEGQ
jgi:enoyl-CoA hydratase/carnithine racemase